MKGLARFAIARPVAVLLMLAILMGAFAAGLPGLQQDSRVEALVSPDEHHVQLKHEMAGEFGNPDFVLIGVEEPDVFTPAAFALVEQVAADLEQAEQVREVHSVFNKQYLRGDDGFFRVGDLVDAAPSRMDFSLLKERLRDTPMYRGNLVSMDHERLALLVEFEPGMSDAAMTTHVNDVLRKHDRLESWHVSGLPVIQHSMSTGMDRDMGLLMPLFLLLLAGMFFLAFRSLRGLLIPFVPILFSVVVTLGAMGWLGIRLTVVSNIIPMLLIAISSAYTVHFMNQYYLELIWPRARHEAAVDAAGRHISAIIALAAVTTIIGFASNVFNPVTAIRDFGLVLSLGIASAALACLTAIPAILSLLREPSVTPDKAGARTDALNRSLDATLLRLGPMVDRRRYLLVLAAGVVMVASLAGISRVEVESSGLSFFRDDSRLVTDSRALSRDFGGVVGFNYLIDTETEDGVKDPEVLATIDRFTDWIKTQYPEEVRVTLTMADYIKQMNKAYNGGEQYYLVPESREEVLQYFEVYAWSGNIREDFRTVANEDWSSTRITGRFALQELPDGSFREFPVQHQREIIEQGSQWLEANLPPGVRAEPFGEIMIAAVINDSIISGQIISLSLAWVVVLLVCMAVMRSVVIGLIAILPVSFAVAVNFGVMGYAGIPLNIGTALVSAMAIGIGIDDTIHYLMTLRRFREKGHDWLESTAMAMKHAGRAILYTTVALVVAYTVMLFSDFVPIAYFGLLNIVTILGATCGALLVMASVLLVVRPEFPETAGNVGEGESTDHSPAEEVKA